jgi:cytochrome c oxidase subunit 2
MFERLPFFPESASTVSGQVDALYLFMVAVSGFFALLIAVLVVVFAIRYRRRGEGERTRAIHGSTALELTWSLIPLGLTMIMFFWGASVYFTIKRPPDNALQVWVVGKQWMWKLQHQEGKREINELHVPRGRPVELIMTSEDVIHSFYVPVFRIKQDVLPGRYTNLWFQATKTGTYHLFCAEYCGTEHSGMIGSIVVMEPSEYESWLSGGGEGVSMVAAGETLFKQLGCATCHNAQSGARGPNLVGVFGTTVHLQSGGTVVADAAYVRESIFNPQAKIVAGFQPVMPTFKGLVSEEGVGQLIAYIKSIGPAAEGNAGGSGGAKATDG